MVSSSSQLSTARPPLPGCAKCPWSRSCDRFGCSSTMHPMGQSGGELRKIDLEVALQIHSPYDIEARFSTKRDILWAGYKVHLTETCEDDAPHLITHVEITPATACDGAVTVTIHTALAAKGLLPQEHFVDAGYLDAEVLAN